MPRQRACIVGTHLQITRSDLEPMELLIRQRIDWLALMSERLINRGKSIVSRLHDPVQLVSMKELLEQE